MSSLLHIACSPRGASSYSRQMAGETIRAIMSRDPDVELVIEDLAENPPRHVDAEFAAENLKFAKTDLGASRVDPLIKRLMDARYVVISTPMYNFTLPSALKAWIDRVVRPSVTFRSTPEGKIGLLPNRPVYIIVSCGGRIGDGPSDQRDFLGPYLRYVLEVVGLTDVNIMMMDQMHQGPDAAAEGFELARTKLKDWFQDRGLAVATI